MRNCPVLVAAYTAFCWIGKAAASAVCQPAITPSLVALACTALLIHAGSEHRPLNCKSGTLPLLPRTRPMPSASCILYLASCLPQPPNRPYCKQLINQSSFIRVYPRNPRPPLPYPRDYQTIRLLDKTRASGTAAKSDKLKVEPDSPEGSL